MALDLVTNCVQNLYNKKKLQKREKSRIRMSQICKLLFEHFQTSLGHPLDFERLRSILFLVVDIMVNSKSTTFVNADMFISQEFEQENIRLYFPKMVEAVTKEVVSSETMGKLSKAKFSDLLSTLVNVIIAKNIFPDPPKPANDDSESSSDDPAKPE